MSYFSPTLDRAGSMYSRVWIGVFVHSVSTFSLCSFVPGKCRPVELILIARCSSELKYSIIGK